MRILDTYQGHGPLTPASLKGYDRVILKLYDPANTTWTKDAIALCRRISFPFDTYSTGGGRHEPPATWAETTRILHALGLNPQAVGVGIDWFEFLVGSGMSPSVATAAVERGVDDAHAANCKAGGYGAVLNAWPWYDRAKIPFDWDWVADPQTPPRRRCDLHQLVQGGQDVDYTQLDHHGWEALVRGPHTPPPPPGGGFMADLTEAQQQTVYYRSLEVGSELAGRKIRLGVRSTATIELSDGSSLSVSQSTTEAEFKGDTGLWYAFKTGLAGA